MQKVVILGAGISGLSLAWYLNQLGGFDVTVVEKQSRAGGWLKTVFQDDFHFEVGPRNFRGEETAHIVRTLGLQDQVIKTSPMAKERYLLRRGELEKVPATLLSALTSPIIQKALWPLARDFFSPKIPAKDLSVGDFFRERLGPKLTSDYVDPLVLGIFGGDLFRLSMAACFPNLWNRYQQTGKLLAFPSSGTTFSLKEGVEVLPEELAKKLGERLLLNCAVTKIECKGPKSLVSSSKGVFEADVCVSTLPPEQLAPLVEPKIAKELRKISAVSLSVVNVGYETEVLPVKGFGYLVPTSEQEEVLGVVFDSEIFPQQNHMEGVTRLTVMMKENSEAEKVALSALKRHLGIKQPPASLYVSHASHSIPQYPVGHLQLMETLQRELSPLYLHGWGYYGVSVNECIARSQVLAEKLYLQNNDSLSTVSKK